jgi:hypothetical protein
MEAVLSVLITVRLTVAGCVNKGTRIAKIGARWKFWDPGKHSGTGSII